MWNMVNIKNVVFDFDGTLVDTAPLIVKTMMQTISEMGLPSRTETECRATIGIRLAEIPHTLWPEREGIGDEYARVYRKIFDELKRPLGVSCFPGVIETLRELQRNGVGMAIASSRSHSSLAEYVDLFALEEIFVMLVGGDDVSHGKPAPDPVLRITETLRWNPVETLTVGDAAVDILMGKGAGTKTCAVTYGNGTRAELSSANPDYMISDFRELTKIIIPSSDKTQIVFKRMARSQI